MVENGGNPAPIDLDKNEYLIGAGQRQRENKGMAENRHGSRLRGNDKIVRIL